MRWKPESLKKTIEFYEKIFGWKFQNWGGPVDYWLIKTGDDSEPGIDGGLSPKGENAALNCPTIDVKDIDKTMEMVKESGGKLITPKMPVLKVGWLFYFEDPEGNMFSVMQEDPNAA